MATIGSITVLLSAKTDAINKGLTQGVNALKGFGGQLGGMFDGVGDKLAGFASGLGPAGGAMGSLASSASGAAAALGPVGIAVGVTAGGVALMGAAATAAGVALFNMALAGGDNIGKLLDAADAMGITTQALAEMRTAAELSGSSAEAMDAGLQKLTQVLGDAVGGTAAAQNAFSRLGLNFRDLANMTPDAAFRSTAEAISQIQNPFERASAAQDIFGKGYAALMPLLKAGPDAFVEGAEKARLFGLAVSQVDAMRVDNAMDSWKQISMIFTGITQTLAVEFAPIIKMVGDGFASLAQSVGGVGPFVSGFFKGVVTDLAAVGDFIMAGAKLWFDYFANPAAQAFMSVMRGLSSVAAAMGNLEYIITGKGDTIGGAVKSVVDARINELRSMNKMNEAMFKAWEQNSLSNRAKGFFDKVAADRAAMEKALGGPTPVVAGADATAGSDTNKQIMQTVQGLMEQRATLGMNAEQMLQYKLMMQGANATQIEFALGLHRAIEAQKEQQALMDQGKRLTESLRTPQEVYNDSIASFEKLLNSGAITQETYTRAVEKAQADLDKTLTKADEKRKARLFDMSTAGTAAMERRFSFDLPRQIEVKDPRESAIKEQTNIAKESKTALDRIARAVEKPQFEVISMN